MLSLNAVRPQRRPHGLLFKNVVREMVVVSKWLVLIAILSPVFRI